MGHWFGDALDSTDRNPMLTSDLRRCSETPPTLLSVSIGLANVSYVPAMVLTSLSSDCQAARPLENGLSFVSDIHCPIRFLKVFLETAMASAHGNAVRASVFDIAGQLHGHG